MDDIFEGDLFQELDAKDAVISRLRSELEAVKREAVGVVKPFANEASELGKDRSDWKHIPDNQRMQHSLILATYGDFRAARAFVEKHGRDG